MKQVALDTLIGSVIAMAILAIPTFVVTQMAYRRLKQLSPETWRSAGKPGPANFNARDQFRLAAFWQTRRLDEIGDTRLSHLVSVGNRLKWAFVVLFVLCLVSEAVVRQ